MFGWTEERPPPVRPAGTWAERILMDACAPRSVLWPPVLREPSCKRSGVMGESQRPLACSHGVRHRGFQGPDPYTHHPWQRKHSPAPNHTHLPQLGWFSSLWCTRTSAFLKMNAPFCSASWQRGADRAGALEKKSKKLGWGPEKWQRPGTRQGDGQWGEGRRRLVILKRHLLHLRDMGGGNHPGVP